jgi:hypothetical protein
VWQITNNVIWFKFARKFPSAFKSFIQNAWTCQLSADRSQGRAQPFRRTVLFPQGPTLVSCLPSSISQTRTRFPEERIGSIQTAEVAKISGKMIRTSPPHHACPARCHRHT